MVYQPEATQTYIAAISAWLDIAKSDERTIRSVTAKCSRPQVALNRTPYTWDSLRGYLCYVNLNISNLTTSIHYTGMCKPLINSYYFISVCVRSDHRLSKHYP